MTFKTILFHALIVVVVALCFVILGATFHAVWGQEQPQIQLTLDDLKGMIADKEIEMRLRDKQYQSQIIALQKELAACKPPQDKK